MFPENDYLQTTKQYFDAVYFFSIMSFIEMYCSLREVTFLLSFQMGAVWNELQPKLGCLFGGNNGLEPYIWKLNRQGAGENTASDKDHKLENNLLCELKKSLLLHNIHSMQ